MVGHIWREWYVVSCMNIQHLSTGMVFGFPAILTPAITANSSDIAATREESSWVVASCALTGPVSYIILPYVLQAYGRKLCNILLNAFFLIGTIIVAAAPNVLALIVGRALQGVSFCGPLITAMTIAEYSHPKRRPIFIIIKTLCVLSGVLLCHGLSIVLTWRQLAWISAVPSAFGLLSTFTWPESPSWLAYKGRSDDSVAAFEWLRGTNSAARKEIAELIVAQTQFRNQKNDSNVIKRIVKTFSTKKFLKPFCIMLALILLYQGSGTHYMVAYIIEIMERLTGDKNQAYYYSMGFNTIKIFGILMSIPIIKFLNRRTIVIWFGIGASLLLGSVCLFDYLHENGKFDFVWLMPLTLISYNLLCIMAILPIVTILKGEIYPLEFKGIGSTISGILHSIISTLTLKFTSNMLVSLKVYGTFLVYLVIILASLIALYFILPETKGRTLQDIETEFIDQKSEIEDEIDVEIPTSKTVE